MAENMKSWPVELTSGEENRREVQTRDFSRQLFVTIVICCVSVTTYTNRKRCCTRISFCQQQTKS